jgi:hypothetical protein
VDQAPDVTALVDSHGAYPATAASASFKSVCVYQSEAVIGLRIHEPIMAQWGFIAGNRDGQRSCDSAVDIDQCRTNEI